MDEHFRHRPNDRHVEPMFAALHADEHGAGSDGPRPGPEPAGPARGRRRRAALVLLLAAALGALLWLWSGGPA